MKQTELQLEKLFNGQYILKEDFKYLVNELLITVPKGFVTDLASIPRPLWIFFPPFGKYNEAAVVHDYLYSVQNTTGLNRKLADKIFKFIMKECGVDCATREVLYLGVRNFGSVFWKKEKINGLIPFDDEVLVNKTKEAIEYYKFYKQYLKF